MPTKTCFAAVFFASIFVWAPARSVVPDLVVLSQGAVTRFAGTESISTPFAFEIDITARNPALNLGNIVGQPLRVTVAPRRTVNGMVERIEQIGVVGGQGLYRVRLGPVLNRLAYRIESRTFETMSAAQIVSTLLNEAGIPSPAVEFRISGSLPTEEIAIQYQESDLAFVSRILEDATVHYHFEPSTSGEKLVLGDSNAAFPALPGGKLNFGVQITAFSRGLAIHSGKVQAGDFNWKNPEMNLTTTAQAPRFADLREDVFPAPVDTLEKSLRYASARLAVRVAEGEHCRGASTVPQLQAGFRFLLAGHPRNDFNQEYVITGVIHEASRNGYRNTFTCLPATVNFRTSPRTPRPVIPGVLPGIVVGPQGERKHVDLFGRVRVRFPWRNAANTNDDWGDSGWVRVAQLASGGPAAVGTAAMWIPDIGDEVLVAFEHGDPRRPVVLGSVWNGRDRPPLELPANRFSSMFRGRSSDGKINEIRFDDASGVERLTLFSGGHSMTFGNEGITVTSSGRTPLILRAGGQYLRITTEGITASSAIRTPPTRPQAVQPSPGLRRPLLPSLPQR